VPKLRESASFSPSCATRSGKWRLPADHDSRVAVGAEPHFVEDEGVVLESAAGLARQPLRLGQHGAERPDADEVDVQ